MKILKKYQKLSSRVVYRNQRLEIRVDVVRLPSKKTYEQAYFVKPNQYSTGIIAIDRGGIYLVKQYRYTAGEWMWQIPMGTTSSQDILSSAKKELKEETGLTAKKWTKLGFIRPEPGMTPQGTYIFLAEDLTTDKQRIEDTEEGMEVKIFSIKKFNEMITKGKITCGYTLSAWQIYCQKSNSNFSKHLDCTGVLL